MRCSNVVPERLLSAAALTLCLAVLAGCGGSSTPSARSGPTGTVKGKVVYSGKSLPTGSTVTWIHQEKAFPATAAIADDGTYSLMMSGMPAIPVGAYKISISPPASKEVSSSDIDAYKAMMAKSSGMMKPSQEKLPFPKKYLSPEESGLTYTVKEGANTFDIEIKD